MPGQINFIFALEPKETWHLAGKRPPSFKSFLVKPSTMQVTAAVIRTLT